MALPGNNDNDDDHDCKCMRVKLANTTRALAVNNTFGKSGFVQLYNKTSTHSRS